jgi:hypothetical protein
MLPFDIAAFATPISFIIAILPGPFGMVSLAVTNLAMFSLVQAIIAADAGLVASRAVTTGTANRIFPFVSP